MDRSWRHSPAWALVGLVAIAFVLGVVAPLEVSMYAVAHQKVAVDESLESSFRVSYVENWSGFGNHWYNYTVTYAALGLVWGDLWMTVFFNGTTTPIPSGYAHTVVNDGKVATFNFVTGEWNPKGAVAFVEVGQTMSVDTAEFDGDGNTLYVAAINGTYYGTFSLVIP